MADIASPPNERYKPKRLALITLGAVAGMLTGLGAAFLAEFRDNGIRTRRDAQAATGVDCLGLFPLIPPTKPKLLGQAIASAKSWSLNGANTARHVPFDYVIKNPFSIGAESVRSVKIAIDHAGGGKHGQVIGVTSAVPETGKSTIAANVAHLIADYGASVLLIDANLRHPTLSHQLSPEASFGLPDLILDDRSYRSVIRKLEESGLDFLPALSRRTISHTNAILGSSAMETFLKLGRKHL